MEQYKETYQTLAKDEMFKQYRRSQIAELRSFVPGEGLDPRISISMPDLEAGSPKLGDMIARNPKNHNDQWLVAAQYFEDNFEPIEQEFEEGWTDHDGSAENPVPDQEWVAIIQHPEAAIGNEIDWTNVTKYLILSE